MSRNKLTGQAFRSFKAFHGRHFLLNFCAVRHFCWGAENPYQASGAGTHTAAFVMQGNFVFLGDFEDRRCRADLDGLVGRQECHCWPLHRN